MYIVDTVSVEIVPLVALILMYKLLYMKLYSSHTVSVEFILVQYEPTTSDYMYGMHTF
jgi:hypothetical protein